MKKVVCGVIFLGLLIASPLAYAVDAKIGYFGLQRVLSESQRGKKERETLAKRAGELKKDIDKKTEELNVLKDELQKKGSMLNEQVRKNKEKDYQQKVTALDRLVKDSNNELEQKRQEILNKFLVSLNKVVTKLGDDEKYTLLFDVGQIAYAPKELDITDKVIKAFDAAKE
jgi:outer membrane protein